MQASGAKNASLRYDPLGRLYEVSGGGLGTRLFLYDGDAWWPNMPARARWRTREDYI